jgi:hypothetical protein
MLNLFKYLLGLAALFSGLAALFSALFLSNQASVDTILAVTTPQWKIARLTADPGILEISPGSLSPIYPATPGKELLGKPVIIPGRVSRKHKEPVIGKSIDKPVRQALRKPIEKPVRQALRMNKLPRQIYAAGEQDRYSQQSLGYTFEPQSQPRVSINFGHGIY